MASLSFPGSYGTSDRSRLFRHLDGWLLGSAALLLVIGLMAQYSLPDQRGESYFMRQVVRAGLGIVPFAVFLLVNPSVWRRYATGLYIVNAAALAAVLLAGRTGGGAQRWLQLGPLEFQPSEMSKLLIVLTVASFLASRHESIRSFKTFILSFLHVLLPIFLVYKQPHLGATLVLVVGWLGVCLAAGVPGRFILATIVVTVAGLGFALQTPGLLKDYQRERVMALINPDPGDNAYQVERAEIAIGSGGLYGTGYLNGEQKKGGFIPEQHTDFIFTVIGEEGGFIGCLLVLGTFAFFLFRIWLVLFQVTDPFYRMVVAGVYSVLAFHAIVNLGSILQLLPVVGLWLPFLSYGGTALWLCLGCVGLVANIRARDRLGI